MLGLDLNMPTRKDYQKETKEKAKKKKETAQANLIPNDMPVLGSDKILPFISLLILIGTAYLVGVTLRPYLWACLIALLLYVAFHPLHLQILSFLKKKLAWELPNFSAGITTLSIFVIIIIPGATLLRLLIVETFRLIKQTRIIFNNPNLVPEIEKNLFVQEWITKYPEVWNQIILKFHEINQNYGKYLNPNEISNWLIDIATFIQGSLNFTLSFIMDLFLILLLLYFLFRDGPKLHKFIITALPFSESLSIHFSLRMQRIINDVLWGNILISILQGLIVGSVLFLCGIQNVISYGVIAAIVSVIPVVGTAIVWLPASLWLIFFEGHVIIAIIMGIVCGSAYLILENIAKPKLLDAKLGIHPIILFFTIIGGITKFGIGGVILGPLCLMLFKTVWDIYQSSEESMQQGGFFRKKNKTYYARTEIKDTKIKENKEQTKEETQKQIITPLKTKVKDYIIKRYKRH